MPQESKPCLLAQPGLSEYREVVLKNCCPVSSAYLPASGDEGYTAAPWKDGASKDGGNLAKPHFPSRTAAQQFWCARFSQNLANNSTERPFLEREHDACSARSHHSQGHLSEGCCSTPVFLHQGKWVLKCLGGRWPGQETKMQTARLGAGSSEEVLTSKTCFRRRVLAYQEQNQ